MTYTTDGLNKYEDLIITKLRFSGTPTLNTFLTFTIDQEFPSAFITSLTQTNTEINLPAGHYFAQAYIDYTRSSATADNCRFHWFVNNTQTGHYGASDFIDGSTVSGSTSDVAEAAFSLISAGTLRLKITDTTGSTLTLNDPHCICIIWRTNK